MLWAVVTALQAVNAACLSPTSHPAIHASMQREWETYTMAPTTAAAGGGGGGGGEGDIDVHAVSVSVVNAISGKEAAFLEDVDPAATTVAHIKAKIREKQPDIATNRMRLVYHRKSHGGGGGHDQNVHLDDDSRTIASHGMVGSGADEDDLLTLQLVIVGALTPEQLVTRSKEVYDAAEEGNEPRLQTAIEAAKEGGADLNWRNPEFRGYAALHRARSICERKQFNLFLM